MKLNRKQFFDGYREAFGPLNKLQVEGLEFLLGKLESDSRWANSQQIAYVLATVAHESAHTFQPIKEFRARAGTPGRKNQDRYWLSGYYGRGYVQITWKRNYEKFGIADEPDKALEPETAYRILSDGMLKGLFTGRAIGAYVNDKETDYVNARKVINGLDKAKEIAKAAGAFESILRSARESDVRIEVPIPEPKPEPKPEKEMEAQPLPPAAPQPPKPPVTPIAAAPTSITTKIAAAVSAVVPVITATGMKIGGVEFKTGGLIAFASVVIVGMVLAAYLWNSSQNRRHEELKLSMQNLASPDKANIIAAGSKV